MNITHFRQRGDGSERLLEDAILSRFGDLFQSDRPRWIGGSVPLGAGLPDIVSVWHEPHIKSLLRLDSSDVPVLAYLAQVARASANTIAARTGRPVLEVEESIIRLRELNAVVTRSSMAFSLDSSWKHVLTDVIAIEAKVADWKRAVQQAARNRIFAHMSYVALPYQAAHRVQKDRRFTVLGIGVISVHSDGEVTIVRRAPRHRPSVWVYYFQLAALTARHSEHA